MKEEGKTEEEPAAAEVHHQNSTELSPELRSLIQYESYCKEKGVKSNYKKCYLIANGRQTATPTITAQVDGNCQGGGASSEEKDGQ